MSTNTELDYTTIEVPVKVAGLLKNLTDLISFRYNREQALVQLLYKKGITQTEIGKHLGVTKAAVSIAYPHGGSK